MESQKQLLFNILELVIRDIHDESNHFIVYAHYTFSFGAFENQGPVYFHKNEIFRIKLFENHMECWLYPITDKHRDHFTLEIKYNQIEKICRILAPEVENEQLLYRSAVIP